MSLLGHLREFQIRLFRSVLGILAGAAIAWIAYDPILDVIRRPFDLVVASSSAQGKDVVLAINGVTEAFSVQLKIVLVAGLVLSLPVWLFQLWRFIAPGLRGSERRWGYLFVGAATPLFLLGAGIAYRAMPSLLEIFLGFTPENVSNIININEYLSFIVQLVAFFGIGMVIPLAFAMLNFAGALTAATLVRQWRWLLIGCLTFAAVATPTPDPLTMLLVATPFMGVVALSLGVMVVNDLRRHRRARSAVPLADHEMSGIDDTSSDSLGAGSEKQRPA